MALTDYTFNLFYFHIGQLAQKTQNLQKLFKKPQFQQFHCSLSFAIFLCTQGLCPTAAEITSEQQIYDYIIQQMLCLKWGKNSTENARSNFPVVLFFKEILL